MTLPRKSLSLAKKVREESPGGPFPVRASYVSCYRQINEERIPRSLGGSVTSQAQLHAPHLTRGKTFPLTNGTWYDHAPFHLEVTLTVYMTGAQL